MCKIRASWLQICRISRTRVQNALGKPASERASATDPGSGPQEFWRLPLATTIRIKLTSDQASYDQAPRRKDNCGACSLLPRSELNSLPPRLGVTTLHEEFNQHFPIKPPDSGRVRGSIILPSATRPVMCPSVCPVLCPAMFSNEFCAFNAGNAIT